ncbi:type VII secretion integral membrane protein EccD [Amycolatopsis antarctica]|uniref:Type VII secretion integral membrane protein EccD n=1 Tax=Amycolatopsis antarctica TaxID=1854586 RepID=A0A263D112_9PSEU|nr:type VII secretion integral membrane protein EccD [Amycolatopsis antarctica]OZM71327.1 type VII secretion integral membrane protein EccD [Amycolatopsis antarctica]
MTTTGLVRLTIDAPSRRIDLALPERSAVAELLPGLLRHAGEGLADEGVRDGGWMLRRSDGSLVDGARTLAAQRVRDGEVLHLVPRRMDWPELEYDDLADTIATGAARTGRLWSPRHTRVTGLVVGAGAVLLGLLAVLRSGPPWFEAGWVAAGIAVLLLAAGTVLSRALGDAAAGAVPAIAALPYASAGGALLVAGEQPLTAWSSPQLLAGCAGLLLASVLGFVGVVDRAAVFTGGATAGLLGVIGAWIGTTEAVDTAGAAAIVAGAVLVLSPLFGPLSVRLGRVPAPVLPRTAADLVRDEPLPPRQQVYATVIRAEGLLTGLIGGSALAAGYAEVLLAADARTSAVILLFLLSMGFCVRARLYPAVRQRSPLLLAGLGAAASLAVGPLMSDTGGLLRIATPVLLVFAVIAVLLGLSHSRRNKPNAYLGRYAELFEVLLVLACVPVVCAVLGLYGLVRGLGG